MTAPTEAGGSVSGYVVEDNAYDIGYWARITGFSRPTCPEEAKGWDQADAEIREEANPGAQP